MLSDVQLIYICFFLIYYNVFCGKLIYDGFVNYIFLCVFIGYIGFNLLNKILLFMKY